MMRDFSLWLGARDGRCPQRPLTERATTPQRKRTIRNVVYPTVWAVKSGTLFEPRSPRPTVVVGKLLAVVALLSASASAELAVRVIQIAPPDGASRVPEPTAQGRLLVPQAISTVDVSADGNFITVGTMAFSHDANIWQFAPDGSVIAKRYFPPWAPMQAATLTGGKAMAVGLAYSRVTSPEPTAWLGRTEDLLTGALGDESVETDSRDGELARLRPGEGDWRTGWFASSLGELFVRGPSWIFKPPNLFLDADGRRQRLRHDDKNLLPTSRTMRMAASADGKRLAFGWLGLAEDVPGLPMHKDAVSVWQLDPNRRVWSARPMSTSAVGLPDPTPDFPGLAKEFHVAPDALVPGRVAASLAINRDGSRVAIVE